MTPKKKKNILLLALVIITSAIFLAFYYTSHREITDPQVLSLRAVNALEDITSYRFNISTNISTPLQGKDVEMISGGGRVDYQNKRIFTEMTMMNQSVEIVVIEDKVYIQESNKGWRQEMLSDRLGEKRSIWESDYDQLAQQRSILLNASNLTMQKEEGGWILDIIPDKKIVLEQVQNIGPETISEEELKYFAIRYWIKRDGYHITKVENRVGVEMNIQGLVTPMELKTVTYYSDYNKKMDIEVPI